MSTPACPFVWYELMTTDAAAATAFYSQVVGWSAADAGMPGMDYTLLSIGGSQIAGLMALTQDMRAAGVPSCWVGYVGVANVDAQAERIVKAGGTLHMPPTDIPGVGRFASFADPQGASLCIFTGSSEEQPLQPPVGTPGTVGWHELMALDGAKAWDFYAEQFGWQKKEAVDMGPMGVYQCFGGADQAFGGMMSKMPEMPVPAWGYYFNVEAIDAAVERVKAGGGQVINGPMQVPGGSWIINAIDPQGAMFSLVAEKR
ncbi:glyoxalase [Paucibacter sp. KBW04]|uniref:VOC family protein n=1 Tax=Paucibacter sp. KBW04 TaxID=2153361 RepID=UPI000F57F378|nr:VOC family protein [Paucibacter sp. KBW04]RQO60592.1 glyoxalase [Paucibacter sp. KBW04]